MISGALKIIAQPVMSTKSQQNEQHSQQQYDTYNNNVVSTQTQTQQLQEQFNQQQKKYYINNKPANIVNKNGDINDVVATNNNVISNINTNISGFTVLNNKNYNNNKHFKKQRILNHNNNSMGRKKYYNQQQQQMNYHYMQHQKHQQQLYANNNNKHFNDNNNQNINNNNNNSCMKNQNISAYDNTPAAHPYITPTPSPPLATHTNDHVNRYLPQRLHLKYPTIVSDKNYNTATPTKMFNTFPALKTKTTNTPKKKKDFNLNLNICHDSNSSASSTSSIATSKSSISTTRSQSLSKGRLSYEHHAPPTTPTTAIINRQNHNSKTAAGISTNSGCSSSAGNSRKNITNNCAICWSKFEKLQQTKRALTGAASSLTSSVSTSTSSLYSDSVEECKSNTILSVKSDVDIGVGVSTAATGAGTATITTINGDSKSSPPEAANKPSTTAALTATTPPANATVRRKSYWKNNRSNRKSPEQKNWAAKQPQNVSETTGKNDNKDAGSGFHKYNNQKKVNDRPITAITNKTATSVTKTAKNNVSIKTTTTTVEVLTNTTTSNVAQIPIPAAVAAKTPLTKISTTCTATSSKAIQITSRIESPFSGVITGTTTTEVAETILTTTITTAAPTSILTPDATPEQISSNPIASPTNINNTEVDSSISIIASEAINAIDLNGKEITMPTAISSPTSPAGTMSQNSYSLDFLHSVGVKIAASGNNATFDNFNSELNNVRAISASPMNYNIQTTVAMMSPIARSSIYSLPNMIARQQQRHRYITSGTGGNSNNTLPPRSGHNSYHPHQPPQLTIASFLQKDLLLGESGRGSSGLNYELQPEQQYPTGLPSHQNRFYYQSNSGHGYLPTGLHTNNSNSSLNEGVNSRMGGNHHQRPLSYRQQPMYNMGNGNSSNTVVGSGFQRRGSLHYQRSSFNSQRGTSHMQVDFEQNSMKLQNFNSEQFSSASSSGHSLSASSLSSLSSQVSASGSVKQSCYQKQEPKDAITNNNETTNSIETVPTTKSNRNSLNRSNHHTNGRNNRNHNRQQRRHGPHHANSTPTTPRNQNFYNLTYVSTENIPTPSYVSHSAGRAGSPRLSIPTNLKATAGSGRLGHLGGMGAMNGIVYQHSNIEELQQSSLNTDNKMSSTSIGAMPPPQAPASHLSKNNYCSSDALASTSHSIISSTESIPYMNTPMLPPLIGDYHESYAYNRSTTRPPQKRNKYSQLKSKSLSSSPSCSSTSSMNELNLTNHPLPTLIIDGGNNSNKPTVHGSTAVDYPLGAFPPLSAAKHHLYPHSDLMYDTPSSHQQHADYQNGMFEAIASMNFTNEEYSTIGMSGHWTSSSLLPNMAQENASSFQTNSATLSISPIGSEQDDINVHGSSSSCSSSLGDQCELEPAKQSSTSHHHHLRRETGGGHRSRARHQGSSGSYHGGYGGQNVVFGQHLRASSSSSAHDIFAHTPPDRFLARAHLIEVKEAPANLLTDSPYDKLSQGIWDKFMSAQQTEGTYKQKMRLWRYLYIIIKNTYPRYGLYLVGSTISGFGSDTSDVDMCLVSRNSACIDTRIEALFNLTMLRDCLVKTGEFDSFNLIEAKVPILRFKDRIHNLEVDLNFNNCVGIKNTHLLYCYSQQDWRLRPLVLIAKLWAQYHNINNAKNMTISSYSLVLMVIHFLQFAVSPPVLPCLHDIYPEKFTFHYRPNDFGYIDMNETIDVHESSNTQTLGELFLKFLEYYSCFNYAQFAISVRTGGLLPVNMCRQAKTVKNDMHQWKELCIEEPFDLTNTARSVYDFETFERVKGVFIASWRILKDKMDINSIFSPIVVTPSILPRCSTDLDDAEEQEQQNQIERNKDKKNTEVEETKSVVPSLEAIPTVSNASADEINKTTAAIVDDIVTDIAFSNKMVVSELKVIRAAEQAAVVAANALYRAITPPIIVTSIATPSSDMSRLKVGTGTVTNTKAEQEKKQSSKSSNTTAKTSQTKLTAITS